MAAGPAQGTAAPPWWQQPMGPPAVPTPPSPPAEAPPPALPPPPAAAPRRPVQVTPIDIRSLLHPAEHSRLMLALSSSAIVFGVLAMAVYSQDGWKILAGLAGALALFGALVWLLLQVARSRLLGGALRVSEATLPELQSVLDEVRARLDYHKHVDVYVLDKVDGGTAMTSYLGTRLIQIEGGLVAELLADERRAELIYLIARHIGQLKARHQRLWPVALLISTADSLKFLQLFLAPYFRATAKSGDQIAAACCGDMQATAAMMNRLLVGHELGSRLGVKGVLDQAATVRRRWLPRLAQLFMSAPHATNRYLNLLTFFARVAPHEISTWRATLDEATASRLAAVLSASPNRRPPRRRPSPVSVLLATLVTGGVLAACGWLPFAAPGRIIPGTPGTTASAANPGTGSLSMIAGGTNASVTGPAGTASTGTASTGTASTGTASTGTASTGTASTGTTSTGTTGPGTAGTTRIAAVSPQQQLLSRMPPGFARTCQGTPVPAADAAQGADAEVSCQPEALGTGGHVTYMHYRTVGAMQSVYAGLVRGVPSGNCSSGPGQGSYQLGSSEPVGGYACYLSTTGHHEFAWTDNRLSVLSIATSSQPLSDLYQWWLGDSGPEQSPS